MATPRNALTTKLFWELMDRWNAADDPAVPTPLGHEGAVLANLLAVDPLLADTRREIAWPRVANRAAPSAGKKPTEMMIRDGQDGIGRTRHALEVEALKKPL
ncbi:MAG: hypothetical protein ABI369_11260 [Acetobacteraceae bacterium]